MSKTRRGDPSEPRAIPSDERLPDKSLAALHAWYQRQKRVLPWRDDPSPYRVWISEIMLQQTQVSTVIPYFERFLARFPTVEALAAAEEQDVLLAWAGLGYYSRARNLKAGAMRIVAQGRFPASREEWLEIPGVGPYTAGAISSIALGQPEPILDGNVERVLSRLRAVGRDEGDAAFKARLWSLSGQAVRRAARLGIPPSDFNQALMELGAMVCAPRAPKCLLCPMARACAAHEAGNPEEFPPRKKPKQWLAVREETHLYLDPSGRVLVERREQGQWRAGLWDLPETERLPPGSGTSLGTVETRHVVTRHKVTRVTHIWRVRSPLRLKAAEAHALGGAPELRWIDPDQPEVPLGSAFRRALREALERID